MKRVLLFITSLFFALAACKDRKAKSSQTADTIQVIKDDSLKVIKETTDKDSLLLNTTKQILILIKNKNYEALADFIHPSYGIRFSPYAYVDTTMDVKFSKEQFINQFKNKRQNKINWGHYDGTGDPIRLTIEKYFQEFVYDTDFLNAEKTSINKAIGTGNDVNNLTEVYNGCDFTESYFSGFKEDSQGMDWRSLRLVYKEYEGKFYLVAIIHAEWTT